MELLRLEEMQALFNKALESENFGFEPQGLYKPVYYALSIGGKRLRPALLLLTAQMYGSKPEKALPAALAIEIFHNSTLVHDDIMDKSPLRRHQPTVYKKWNTNTAILAGDALMLIAYKYLAQVEAQYLPQVLPLFTKTALQVCEGQQYDLDFENNMEVRIADYVEMIRLKTSVLLAGSAQIGAILGNATPEQQRLIYSFAENLGIAFQIQDDYLDVFGDKSILGKRIGGDIVARKKTYLLIKSLELSNGAYKEQLIGLVNSKSIPAEEKIEKVTEIYRNLQIDKITRETITKYFDTAYENLDKIRTHGYCTDALMDFANQLSGRKY